MSKFTVYILLTVSMMFLFTMTASGQELGISGAYTGWVNDDSINVEIHGIANAISGQAICTVLVRWPKIPEFPPKLPHWWVGTTYFCIYSPVFAQPFGEAMNFYDLTAGYGGFTHNRIYHYIGYPNDSVVANVSVQWNPDSLTFSGNWEYHTSSLPTDPDDVEPFDQLLAPAGDGLVEGSATICATQTSGDSLFISFMGQWDLGPGVNLPFAEIANCDFDFFPLNDSMYVFTANCTVRTTEVIPTLTEWGLIIFGVLLAGWMAWVILRRKRRVVAGI